MRPKDEVHEVSIQFSLFVQMNDRKVPTFASSNRGTASAVFKLCRVVTM